MHALNRISVYYEKGELIKKNAHGDECHLFSSRAKLDLATHAIMLMLSKRRKTVRSNSISQQTRTMEDALLYMPQTVILPQSLYNMGVQTIEAFSSILVQSARGP